VRWSDWIRLSGVFFKCVGRLPARHLWYFGERMRNENPHRHEGKTYINTFFPPIPSRAFDRFLEAVIARRRIPYSTYFAVTDECPYSCGHCSYGHRRRGHLDSRAAKEVMAQIKQVGTITVGLTGGEPLLREDVVDLVAAIGEETASVMFTSGYSLTGERARQLKQAGLGCLMVGLESDDAGEHDRVRGVKGSFETGWQAVDEALAAGLYTAISTVGTHEKIARGTMERLAEQAQRRGVHEVRILEPVATGRWQGEAGEMLTEAESRRLADFHVRWNRRGVGPAVASFSYLESDEMFGCGAGYHHLFIDAVGNVCPCDLTPLSFGNCLEEPLEAIWQKMERHFGLPRCGCFMREASKAITTERGGAELPLGTVQSEALCQKCVGNGELPRIYRNYLRAGKPAGR
jgi:MoaA/NifB/PqqE/SkfB family radical SAM enzyme